MEPIAGQEIGGFGVVHFRQFGFHLAADGCGRRVGPVSDLVEFVPAGGGFQIVAQRGALANVKCIQNRFLRKKHEALDELLFFRSHFQLAQRLLFLQRFL